MLYIWIACLAASAVAFAPTAIMTTTVAPQPPRKDIYIHCKQQLAKARVLFCYQNDNSIETISGPSPVMNSLFPSSDANSWVFSRQFLQPELFSTTLSSSLDHSDLGDCCLKSCSLSQLISYC